MSDHEQTTQTQQDVNVNAPADMQGESASGASSVSIGQLLSSGKPLNSAKPETILQLQRVVGNQAVLKLLQRDETASSGSGDAPTGATRTGTPPPAPADDTKPDPLKVVLTGEDRAQCMQLYKEVKSWETLKKRYVSGDPPNYQLMAKLWMFRREYVVNLIKKLRADEFPDLLAKSVGSNDLTSDYDVTLASPGSGNDVKAIKKFNDTVKAEFGVQSGTLFDTNLYARDFAKVDQSSEFKEGTAPDDDAGLGALSTFSEMEGDVEDVGALIKVRRYMSQDEWDAHTEEVAKGVGGDKEDAIRRRYQEADAIYQIATANLLQQVKESLNETNQELTEQVESTPEPPKPTGKKKDSTPELTAAQTGNTEQLSMISDENPDLVLEKSNDIYLERMTVIREIQGRIATLQAQLNSLKAGNVFIGSIRTYISSGMADFFNNLVNGTQITNLQKQIDAKKAQIKQLMSEAIFYAAEAYTSEGAILHVVAGIQGSKLTDDEKRGKSDEEQQQLLAQKMKAANDKLTLDNLLQSVNEQFGDFLKDYAHLSHGSTGTMYIKSSKYIDRMLDAIDILAKREPAKFLAPADNAINAAFGVDLATLRGSIKELLAARKDPTKWEGRREEESVAIMATLGIRSMDSYKAAIIKLGGQINVVIRKQLDLATRQDEDRYFQNLDTEGMKKLDPPPPPSARD